MIPKPAAARAQDRDRGTQWPAMTERREGKQRHRANRVGGSWLGSDSESACQAGIMDL